MSLTHSNGNQAGRESWYTTLIYFEPIIRLVSYQPSMNKQDNDKKYSQLRPIRNSASAASGRTILSLQGVFNVFYTGQSGFCGIPTVFFYLVPQCPDWPKLTVWARLNRVNIIIKPSADLDDLSLVKRFQIYLTHWNKNKYTLQVAFFSLQKKLICKNHHCYHWACVDWLIHRMISPENTHTQKISTLNQSRWGWRNPSAMQLLSVTSSSRVPYPATKNMIVDLFKIHPNWRSREAFWSCYGVLPNELLKSIFLIYC